MSAQERKIVSVRVPATSANLGVGYDCLGIALDLWMRVHAHASHQLLIRGGDERFRSPDNLVWTSFVAARAMLGLDDITISLEIDSDIPRTGGLGSSAACVLAGVLLAQAIDGHEIDVQRSLDMATAIEGHPDNVAPALLGGLVSTFVAHERAYSTRFDVDESLRFVVVAPAHEINTKEARKRLPSEFSRDDVVWQMGRCVASVHALSSGDAELFGAACDDRLHEPYRKLLISDYNRLREAALGAGAHAYFISGSGSAMVALASSDVQASHIEQVLKQRCPDAWIQSLAASPEGAQLL